MLEAIDITKTYGSGELAVQVLKPTSLTIEPGEFVSIVGRSGSGKTTLLNVLSTLLRPDSGSINYHGEDVSAFSEHGINLLRQEAFSMIFQSHHLLPYMTALENVLLPHMNGVKPISGNARGKAVHCLKRVGLAGREDALPGNLSGGERQRVAVARALASDARILFADEPTGSLDKATGDSIMDLLHDLADEGLAVIMVTHDPEHAARAHRIITMEGGALVS